MIHSNFAALHLPIECKADWQQKLAERAIMNLSALSRMPCQSHFKRSAFSQNEAFLPDKRL